MHVIHCALLVTLSFIQLCGILCCGFFGVYCDVSARSPNQNLTLRLIMSYICGAPSKARNANVVYVYGPTFGNAETVSFYLLHNVSALNQCREVSCVTFVCKHFAS